MWTWSVIVRRMTAQRMLWMVSLLAWFAFECAAKTRVDSAKYDPSSYVSVVERDDQLYASWPIDHAQRGVMVLSLDPSKPLIASLALGPSDDSARSILRDVQPCGVLTVG